MKKEIAKGVYLETTREIVEIYKEFVGTIYFIYVTTLFGMMAIMYYAKNGGFETLWELI